MISPLINDWRGRRQAKKSGILHPGKDNGQKKNQQCADQSQQFGKKKTHNTALSSRAPKGPGLNQIEQFRMDPSAGNPSECQRFLRDFNHRGRTADEAFTLSAVRREVNGKDRL